MNAQPQRGAFAAFPKQNDKCPGGEEHAWNWLSHYLSFVVILTGLEVISDLELLVNP